MKITKTGAALLIILALLLLAAAVPLTVSNFTQVHIDKKPQGGTATPRLFVTNLDGPSDIIVAEDNATPVFAVRSGGAVEVLVGPFTTTGNQTVTGAFTVTGATNLGGNLSSQSGALTITDNVIIDGAADAIQLTVQGWTTQTTSLLVLEQSDGTDVATVSNAGNTDVAGTLQFGADNVYALGYASSAQQIACVSATITGTASVAVTGVTTPTWGIATLVTDPGTGAGDPAMVTFDTPTTTTLQVNVWQDDFSTAATVVATVHVCAIGDE